MSSTTTYTFTAQAKASTVESDPLEGIPQIDESTVETLLDQVTHIAS